MLLIFKYRKYPSTKKNQLKNRKKNNIRWGPYCFPN